MSLDAVNHARPVTNPPFAEASLDRALARWVPPSDKEPLVRSVAVVGALLDSKNMLFGDDVRTIEQSFTLLGRAGIGIDPAPSFQFYNLLAPVRSDFLKAALVDDIAPKADLLIVCGVWGGRSRDYTSDRFHPDQIEKPYENFQEVYWDRFKGYRENREVSISRLQCAEGVWADAADAVGAKIVVTRGPDGIDAINSDDFLSRPFYKAAAHTKDQVGYVSGIICGSLSFLVHESAVPLACASAKPSDRLGARILALHS